MTTTTEGSTMSTCPDCYGTGVIEGELCPLCKGHREPGLRVGSRVRLYSGGDTGTIAKVTDRRAIVRWDTGRTGSWPLYALQRLADQNDPGTSSLASLL